MKILIALFAVIAPLFAGVDDPYYNGLAEDSCQKAVRLYVEQSADHEYWFGTYQSDFFPQKDIAYRVAIFSGDNLKIKNRLGIFQQYRYTCIYRTDMREVIMVQVGKITLGRTRRTEMYRSRRRF